MDYRDLKIEKLELEDQILILNEENKKLKAEIEYHKIYEDELKSQLTTERCMRN